MTKPCKRCGKEFNPLSGHETICDDCRRATIERERYRYKFIREKLKQQEAVA